VSHPTDTSPAVGRGQPRRKQRSPWPPIVAILASLGVFVGVLLVTPPGLVAVPTLVLGSARGVQAQAAAYAAGAAAALALVTLLGLALLLVLVDWVTNRRSPNSIL